MTKKLLMGNEAMAHAALEAGVRVVAGYPGTPSSEIVETVAKLHALGVAHGVHVEWSTNEKAALELLFGASLAGARGLFTCKQMGLNVASDALMSLNYVSVRGGLVLVVADDPGPISSQTEQDTRRFASFAKVPVLDPASPEQAFDMVKAAFELSERHHTPVIVRPTTRVDHASAFFDVEDETHALEVPEGGFERDVPKWVIFPRRAYQAHGEINERLLRIANEYASRDDLRTFNVVEGSDQAVFGIVAGGVSASYAREALRIVSEHAEQAGIEMPACRFMQVGTPYPFPDDVVAEFAKGLDAILVIEELDHVIEDALACLAGRTHASFTVHGKLTNEAKNRGENSVDDAVVRIEKFLGIAGRLRRFRRELRECDDYVEPVDYPEDLPVRPPVLCAGCPHRGSFYAVKQALGRTPAVLCGDIGCYTLGNAQPLDAVDTCLCMGGGITMAQGFAIADPGKKAIAFVGDSTFFASAMTGLANAAYNGHDITVMVLDNSTTAMTGSQPHPGTGQTLMGPRNAPLSIERVLNANGFTHVFHANPFDKDASIVASKAAIAYEGPSAVIFEAPCVQLVKPKAPVEIDTTKCTGCKKCITEIGCPAIGFDTSIEGPRSKKRGQAFIDAALCYGCDLCTQVCPFRAIETPLVRMFGVGAAVGAAPAEETGSVAAAAVAPVAATVEKAPAVTAVEEATVSTAAKAEDAGVEATEQASEPAEPAGSDVSNAAGFEGAAGTGESVEPEASDKLEETEEFEELAVGDAPAVSAEGEETIQAGGEVAEVGEAAEAEDAGEAGEAEDAGEAEVEAGSPSQNAETPEPSADALSQEDGEPEDDAVFSEVTWGDEVEWDVEDVEGADGDQVQMGYKPLMLGDEPLINTVTMKDELRTARGGIASRISSVIGRFSAKAKPAPETADEAGTTRANGTDSAAATDAAAVTVCATGAAAEPETATEGGRDA